VALGVPGAPVRAGNITPRRCCGAPGLCCLGLIIRKVPGAILLGIVLTPSWPFVTRTRRSRSSVTCRQVCNYLCQLDFAGPSLDAFPIVLTISLCVRRHHGDAHRTSHAPSFSTTKGTFRRSNGLCGGCSFTCVSARLGTKTAGALSNPPPASRRRTHRLTALTTAACFALTLFFSPLSLHPAQAYARR